MLKKIVSLLLYCMSIYHLSEANPTDFATLFKSLPNTPENSLRIFDEQVLKNTRPVVIKVSTKTCGPCIMTKQPYHQLAQSYANKVIFHELDAHDFMAISNRLQVSKVPLFVCFFRGQEQCRFLGSGGLTQLRDYLRTMAV